MNQVILIGRSGADPELKHTQTGMAVLNISVATSEKIKDTNEYKSTWHRVVIFGKQAEDVASKLKKGYKVSVVGRLNYNEWTDKNNNKQKSTDILAYQVEVSIPSQKQPEQPIQQPPTKAEEFLNQKGMDDLDIPF